MSPCFKGFIQLFVKFTRFPHPGKKSVYVPFILTLQTGNSMTKFSEMSRHLHSFGQTLATRSSLGTWWAQRESLGSKTSGLSSYPGWLHWTEWKQGNNIPNFPLRCLQLMGKNVRQTLQVGSTVWYFDFCLFFFFAAVVLKKKSIIGRSEL